MSHFRQYIGIDYSGAKTATSRLPGLEIYTAARLGEPQRMQPPQPRQGSRVVNWTRAEIAEWLIQRTEVDDPFIAGIDHAFSLPDKFCGPAGLRNWSTVLSHVANTWPSHEKGMTVDKALQSAGEGNSKADLKSLSRELRLCEKWTASAKSAFLFDVQGSVAKSTIAGLPWLRQIREKTKGRIHWWPFDGWDLPGDISVVAEVYPALFKRRFANVQNSPDQHDAYSVARWLQESDYKGMLPFYLAPPLTAEERKLADLEGWILGVL